VYGCRRSGVLFYLFCYDGLAYACGGQGDLCWGCDVLCGVGYVFGKFTAALGWIWGDFLELAFENVELWIVNGCSNTSEVLLQFGTCRRSRFQDPCNQSQCLATTFG